MVANTAKSGFSELILENEQAHILLFKTNIQYKKDMKIIGSLLAKANYINSWNVDLDDCDKVLRIESKTDDHQIIISIIQNAGFRCEELAD